MTDNQEVVKLPADEYKSGYNDSSQVEESVESVIGDSMTARGRADGENGETDFSIGPNAEYYVQRPDDVYMRLRSFIATSRGGVFGITGVRGAGKSVLLKRIEAEFEDKHHTLQIPAPVSSSEETAFFTMLFRQLCRSVITYINLKVLKKEGELALLSRQEYRKWLYSILILFPFLIVGMYGGWFYWKYYSEYIAQSRQIISVFENQFDLLKKTHENAVDMIVNAVRDGTMTAVREDSAESLRASTDTVIELEQQVRTAEAKLKSGPEEQVAQADSTLQPLLFLQKWEKRFAEEFGSWQKVFGKMPHPLQVLYFDLTGSKKELFSLERFFGDQKMPFELIVKKNGLSSRRADNLIKDFRSQALVAQQKGEFKEAWPLADKRLLEFFKVNSETFYRISQKLSDYIKKVQIKLDLARQDLLRAQADLKNLKESLLKEQKSAANSVGGATKEASKEASSTAELEAKEIRNQASHVYSAIIALDAYPETFGFDVYNSKNWRSLKLPSEKHAAQNGKDQFFENLLNHIDNSVNTFVGEIIKRDLVKQYAQAKVNDFSMKLKQAQGFLSDAMGSIKATDSDFLELRDRGIGPLIVVAIAFGAVLAPVLFFYLGIKARQALKHGDVLGLRKRSEDIIRSLDYEVTRSHGSKVDLPLLKRLGASFSFSEQQRGRTLTLPGLTARYVEYIRDVQRVLEKKYGSSKLIICIDELDKITDPEQVGNVLREIKGALYEKDCFYLFSISEDAVRAFEGRLVRQRDIFESTFDEIMFLDKMDLETCVEVARERCKGAGYGLRTSIIQPVHEALEIAAVLSSGVPRELLRNLRAVEIVAGSVHDFEPLSAWHTLFKRKLREILQNVRTANGQEQIRADFIAEIESFLAHCEIGYDGADIQNSLKKTHARTNTLMSECEALHDAFKTAEMEIHATALRSDIKQLQAWLKYSMELEIHLMVRQCSLTYSEREAKIRHIMYANLLAIYGGLPYSTEATYRRLSQMKPPIDHEAAISFSRSTSVS
jgi:hypothetical protein